MKFTTFLLCFAFAYGQPEEWKRNIAEGNWLYSPTQEFDNTSPAIGNGYIATVIYSDTIYMSGMYNGNKTEKFYPSHRARIPSTLNVIIQSIDGKMAETTDCALDIEHGIYIQRTNNAIEQTIYAHRDRKYLAANRIRSLSGTHEVCFYSNTGNPSYDINFTLAKDNYATPAMYFGWTQEVETPKESKKLITLATWEPNNTRTKFPRKGQIHSWFYCINISSNDMPMDLYSVILSSQTTHEAELYYSDAIKTGWDKLMQEHLNAWESLRNKGASIHISGNPEIARITNASIYELFISLREDEFSSISPGGLPTNEYNGHIFWDYETWIFPSLLFLYPQFAKNGLLYRANRLSAAIANAVANNNQGAMFPWESSSSGEETTPTYAPTGLMEQHVSADIAIAFRQYDGVHRNQEFRKNVSCPVILEVANYLREKAEKDAKGKYHILNVIPPDEYAINVSDSIYTNSVAMLTFLYANECSKSEAFIDLAKNMSIPLNTRQQYHPEFVGYKPGSKIKQADTTLIQFPLELEIDSTISLNNIKYYGRVTDKFGPAMSWSMYFIGYLDISTKESDYEFAVNNYFYKSYKSFVKAPYSVWWENIEGGATHFATGAGGFLQTLLYGFAGLRVSKDINSPHIIGRLKPVMPTYDIGEIIIKGISFLEGEIKMDIWLDPIRYKTSLRVNKEGVSIFSNITGFRYLYSGYWNEIQTNIGLVDKAGYQIVFINSGSRLTTNLLIIIVILIISI